ncbi:hypothetical protein GGP77_001643 [Salinibacter ruber]|uniref:hypothetical protein n=1 Tax=Salinibacter ruber TaxID=146919 RepID=UPI002167B3FD|nr:hypothetical protein [Salinibacter ruber]MCS3667414.1 hypothetical protein [Salinibacter ruber]
MSGITINIPAYDDPAALLKPDDDLTADHQAVFLRLRPKERSVSVQVLRKVVRDSTPMSLHHGREYRLKVDPQVDATQLRDWVEDHAGLIEQIFDGHSVKWDGSNQTGRLTKEASVAKDRLRALLVDGQRHPSYRLRGAKGELPERNFNAVERREVGVPTHDVRLWSAGDWLAPAEDEVIEEFGLSEETGEDRLAEVARQLEEEARADGIKVHGTEEYLRGLFESVDF